MSKIWIDKVEVFFKFLNEVVLVSNKIKHHTKGHLLILNVTNAPQK